MSNQKLWMTPVEVFSCMVQSTEQHGTWEDHPNSHQPNILFVIPVSVLSKCADQVTDILKDLFNIFLLHLLSNLLSRGFLYATFI